MTRSLRVLVLSVIVLGIAGTVLADNWERFRGPNGDGISSDKNIPVTFGPKENLLWKVPIPGAGNSSPVVWGKRVFIHTASADAKQRMLLCLDADTGKTLWEKTIPGTKVPVRYDSSQASSTPVTDGEAVYVAFWNGKDIILAAYDVKGEPMWNKNLGVFLSQHGAGASPIIYKDKLIFALDMDAYTESKDKKVKTPTAVDRPSVLMAFNKKTGDVLWETVRPAERACYSAPSLLQKPGQTEPELVIVSTHAVSAYNLQDGKKTWEAKDWQVPTVRMPLRTIACSAMVGDVLVACSGDGAGDRLAVGIELPKNGNNGPPKKLWENAKDFPYVPCPLSRGDHFYFVNDSGYAGCYDAKTGKRVWYERLDEAAFTSSPVMIDGKVYAPNVNGEVFVFAAEPKLNVLAQNSMGEKMRASPAVADGRLYLRGERSLFCIGKK